MSNKGRKRKIDNVDVVVVSTNVPFARKVHQHPLINMKFSKRICDKQIKEAGCATLAAKNFTGSVYGLTAANSYCCDRANCKFAICKNCFDYLTKERKGTGLPSCFTRGQHDRVNYVLLKMAETWPEYAFLQSTINTILEQGSSSSGNEKISYSLLNIVFGINIYDTINTDTTKKSTDEDLDKIAVDCLRKMETIVENERKQYDVVNVAVQEMFNRDRPSYIEHNRHSTIALSDQILPHMYKHHGLTPTSVEQKADAVFPNNIYTRYTSGSVSLKEVCMYTVQNQPNQIVVFHGTTSDCEDGLCNLILNHEGNLQSSVQKLGPGFYVSLSFDEALSYACQRIKQRRHFIPTLKQVTVLEIIIDNIASIISVPPARTNGPVPDTHTFVRNTTPGYYNQICVHMKVMQHSTRIKGIHRFTSGRFLARDEHSTRMGTTGLRTKPCDAREQ